MPFQDGAFVVDQSRRARQPRFEQDDTEAFVDGGMDEDDRAGHRFMFFLFRDESDIQNVRFQFGRGIDRSASGENQLEFWNPLA